MGILWETHRSDFQQCWLLTARSYVDHHPVSQSKQTVKLILSGLNSPCSWNDFQSIVTHYLLQLSTSFLAVGKASEKGSEKKG